MSSTTVLPSRETTASRLQFVALLVVLTALYAALGRATWEWLAIRLPGQRPFPLLWPSTGFAFAVLILGGRRWWPMVTVGSLVLTVGFMPWPSALLISLGNTLEALIAVHWIRGSSRGRLSFVNLRDIWRFLGRACVVPPWISALLGTFAWWLLDPSKPPEQLFEVHWRWWLTNATGLLVVAPPLISWLGPRLAPQEGARVLPGEAPRHGEAALALGLSLLVALVAFGGKLDGTLLALWPPFASIPFSLWTSLRHGPREATTVSLIFTLVAGWGTAQGQGPFSATTGLESAGIFWPFVVSMTVITLVMSVLLSEQRRAESERQAGLELLEGIVDNLPALVSVRDEKGRNLFVNRAMSEAYALSPEELLGQTAAETIGGTIGPEITELDREVMAGSASSSLSEPTQPRRLEIREPSLQEEGRLRHYLTTKHLLSGSVPKRLLTIAFDITDLKTAQAARERSESQLRSVLENIDGWVLTTDLSGTLFFANRPFPDADLKDMIASPVSSFVHSGDRYSVEDAIDQTVVEGRRQTLEVRAAWGQQPWIECRISPVLQGEDVHELMITLVDVEDRRRAEAERSRLHDQMQKMHNLESLGALAGGIAHDFNNLLTAVLGNAARAATEVAEDSKAHRNLLRIEGAAERAAELCQQMLDFAGKAPTEKSPRDLSNLVHSMVEAVRGALPESTLLDLDLGEGLSPVLCDPTQIRRIVMNLITNAADALEGRPGTIRVVTAERRLGRSDLTAVQLGRDLEPGPYVVLEVEDEGCGMTRETRDQIFQPFFTTKFAGRGLGLAAVGGTMRGHRGGIVVASEPGAGTTFTLLFHPTEQRAETEPEFPETSVPEGESGLILVADDQEVVRELARASLEEAGFTVIVAHDGQEARRQIAKHFEALRLAVLDHSMPGASGLEVIQELEAEGLELPCLLSSGFDPTKLGNATGSATGVAFLRKPYRPADLVREVRRALSTDSEP